MFKLKNGFGNLYNSKIIGIEVTSCEGPECERDKAKIKEFLDDVQIAIAQIDKNVDFEKYDGKATRTQFLELMRESPREEIELQV